MGVYYLPLRVNYWFRQGRFADTPLLSTSHGRLFTLSHLLICHFLPVLCIFVLSPHCRFPQSLHNTLLVRNDVLHTSASVPDACPKTCVHSSLNKCLGIRTEENSPGSLSHKNVYKNNTFRRKSRFMLRIKMSIPIIAPVISFSLP